MITPPILRISSEENEQIASSEERTLATNRLPRILLICYSYPPVLGGSEIEAQRVASGLIDRGYKVEVLTGAEPPMPTQFRWIDPCGVPVRIIGAGWYRRWQPRIFALGIAWVLWREQRSYQLVYFLMQGLHLAVGLPISRWLNKPVVMKISGSAIIPRMQESWLGRLELRWLRRWAKRIMILNEGMIGEAVDAGFDSKQLYWMPNPVNINHFQPASEHDRARLRGHFQLTGPTVIYVGRLAPEKQLNSLIRGFALAAATVRDVTLVLVGDGPLRKDLEAQARQIGIDGQIRFVGRTSQVHEWLQASDVFALVSSIEGFSCALAEAMGCGLPSVVSDIPGNRQLIESEVHGLRVPVRDEKAIARSLQRLLGDEALRTWMGSEARQHIVDNYSTSQVLDRYEALFRNVLNDQCNLRSRA
jgi:glycosyltransferase involved in cell wall biosynthesis